MKSKRVVEFLIIVSYLVTLMLQILLFKVDVVEISATDIIQFQLTKVNVIHLII